MESIPLRKKILETIVSKSTLCLLYTSDAADD